MKIVIQKVKQASVSIDGVVKSKIGKGLLVFLGIAPNDTIKDIEWLCAKIVKMRIFLDENGKMNLSVAAIGGDIIVVSQFTLHANTKKGNRPSYLDAAKPLIAIPLYEQFIQQLEKEFGKTIGTGTFGAMMDIALINDGPVTILMDSKNP